MEDVPASAKSASQKARGPGRLGTLVVTGGARGIGAAVARRAALDGFDVAVNYVEHREAAERVAASIVAMGGRAVVAHGDVGKEADVLSLCEAATRELGPVRGLVNGAGITGGFRRVADLPAEVLSRVLAVNVVGTVLCSREAVKRMSTTFGGSGGSIVNVSSIASRLGGAGEWVHYALCKGAVDTFTMGLAREVAREGIRVNVVAPGLIDTELHAEAGAPDRVHRLAATIPLNRAGTSGEIAEPISFLLSEAASYITGVILDVGGGR